MLEISHTNKSISETSQFLAPEKASKSTFLQVNNPTGKQIHHPLPKFSHKNPKLQSLILISNFCSKTAQNNLKIDLTETDDVVLSSRLKEGVVGGFTKSFGRVLAHSPFRDLYERYRNF